MTPPTIDRDTVRRLAVYKQGLHHRPDTSDKAGLKAIIARIGLLQLDSISVTARSHYLVMLARAGLYDVDELDALLPERYLFEYWAHAACLIPMADFGHFAPLIDQRTRDQYATWFQRMGDDPDVLLAFVKDEIRGRGPLSSQDFDTPRPGQGGWWNRKPAKYALEYLFETGELMIDHRQHFRRYYELADRVLAAAEYESGHTADEFPRFAVLRSLRYMGIGTTRHIADYYRLKQREAQAALDYWHERGSVQAVEVPGWDAPAYLRADDAPLVAAIQDGDHPPQLTAFLSPFDNLIWHRDRTEDVFDFFYRIEVYTPKAQRKYGYYVLPVLHKGRLVGRIDPKIDRKQQRFIIHALHLEPGVTVDEALVTGLRAAIHEFMAFHDCETVQIDRCDAAPHLRDLLTE